MSHVKSTLVSSDLIKKMSAQAKKQNQVRKNVLSAISPMLAQEVTNVYMKDNVYYIEIKSRYAIIAMQHALKNLGFPFKVFAKT